MKKYLIVNDDGTKKTIYAKNLMQALKLGDAINITPGMFITLKVGPQHCVYRVKEINHGKYGVVLVCYTINEDGQLVERDAGGNYSFDSLKKNVTNIFNTYDEAKKYLLHRDAVRTAYITGLKSLRKKNDSVDATVIDKPIDAVDEAYNPEYSIQQFKSYISNVMKDLYGNEYNVDTVRAISKLDACVSQVIDDFKADIKNLDLDKRKTVQYYTQYVDALYEELTDVANVQNINGQSLKKIDDIYEKMTRSIHDSKLEDTKLNDASLTNGDWFTLRNERDATIYKIVSVSHDSYVTDVYRVDVDFDAKRTSIKKIGSKSFHTSNIRGRDDITTLAVKFNSAEEAINWLKRQLRLKKHEFDSKFKDEASLATSINALVTDEKAAIDAYDVAIKNLEGKIDEDAKQVLINIRDDERRHIENLYAILNNQVTEKNLEDSIKHDSRIRDTFEVLWYTDEELNNYETKEFRSRSAAMDFYNAHKNDKDKFAWWVTRRNSDWAVVEDIVY